MRIAWGFRNLEEERRNAQLKPSLQRCRALIALFDDHFELSLSKRQCEIATDLATWWNEKTRCFLPQNDAKTLFGIFWECEHRSCSPIVVPCDMETGPAIELIGLKVQLPIRALTAKRLDGALKRLMCATEGVTCLLGGTFVDDRWQRGHRRKRRS